jgi:hypothetical protein
MAQHLDYRSTDRLASLTLSIEFTAPRFGYICSSGLHGLQPSHQLCRIHTEQGRSLLPCNDGCEAMWYTSASGMKWPRPILKLAVLLKGLYTMLECGVELILCSAD